MATVDATVRDMWQEQRGSSKGSRSRPQMGPQGESGGTRGTSIDGVQQITAQRAYFDTSLLPALTESS